MVLYFLKYAESIYVYVCVSLHVRIKLHELFWYDSSFHFINFDRCYGNFQCFLWYQNDVES